MRHRTIGIVVERFLVPLALLVLTSLLIAQDKSVRPGINKQFENPNVNEWVGKFERDGREPFDHRREIVDACRLRPGMAVADIGTGTGLFARLFSQLVGPQGRVYAVDISDKFVKHVEETTRQEGLTNIVGVVCRPDSVNLPPDSIDLAFICDTYHHFEFPTKVMRSIHRALRPGGQVVLIDFHRIEGKTSDWVMNHVRAGQEVFTREILDSGFRQVENRKDLLKESYFVRFAKTGVNRASNAPGRQAP
jgi:SAM-dependent methyltransferase